MPVWTDKKMPLEIDITPKALAPGEIGTFGFYLNTFHEENIGPVEYVVEIKPDKDSLVKEAREIKITAAIVPDSRSMSVEEIENSPRAYLLPEFYDFGESESDSALPFEFEILNDGNSTLEVNRVYSYNDGVEINSFTKKINGGKKGKIKGLLSIDKLPVGPFRVRVEVITNDPLHPIRTENLVGIKL